MPRAPARRSAEVPGPAMPPLPPPGSHLPQGRFSGRTDFQQLVRDALAAAAREGWPELILSDASFADWPLGERAVQESLQAWSRSGRRMTLLACGYDEMVRRHPRFVRWRGTWDHLLSCRACSPSLASDLPSALWSPDWALERLDPVHCVGVSGGSPERRVLLRQALGEWLQFKSAPAFAATTLGL